MKMLVELLRQDELRDHFLSPKRMVKGQYFMIQVAASVFQSLMYLWQICDLQVYAVKRRGEEEKVKQGTARG